MAKTRTHAVPRDPRKIHQKLRSDLRKRVIATYDTCAICGREVDKTLYYLDPLAPEVDEIIPVSRGGSPYDWDNLQLVHRICNQRKGNKMAGDIDLKKVENPTPISRSW
jgi:5-methylcytosine-specific restriction endonuclease McrA